VCCSSVDTWSDDDDLEAALADLGRQIDRAGRIAAVSENTAALALAARPLARRMAILGRSQRLRRRAVCGLTDAQSKLNSLRRLERPLDGWLLARWEQTAAELDALARRLSRQGQGIGLARVLEDAP
jgi:hypothetical protein